MSYPLLESMEASLKSSLEQYSSNLKSATDELKHLQSEKEQYQMEVFAHRIAISDNERIYKNNKKYIDRLGKILHLTNLVLFIVLLCKLGLSSSEPYFVFVCTALTIGIIKKISTNAIIKKKVQKQIELEEKLHKLINGELHKDYDYLISQTQSKINSLREDIDRYSKLYQSNSSFLTNVNKLNQYRNILTDENILQFIFHHNKSFGQRLPLTELFEKLANYSNCYAQTVSISQNELILYRQLVAHASRMGLAVSFQMRLSDIIDLGDVSKYSGTSMEEVQGKYRDFLRNRHVDFALISVNDGRCKLCIELDDSSHYDISNPRCTNQTMYNHVIKDLLLSYCGVPLLRLDRNNYPNLASIISNSMSNKCTTYHYTDENLIRFKNALNSYSHNTK